MLAALLDLGQAQVAEQDLEEQEDNDLGGIEHQQELHLEGGELADEDNVANHEENGELADEDNVANHEENQEEQGVNHGGEQVEQGVNNNLNEGEDKEDAVNNKGNEQEVGVVKNEGNSSNISQV